MGIWDVIVGAWTVGFCAMTAVQAVIVLLSLSMSVDLVKMLIGWLRKALHHQ